MKSINQTLVQNPRQLSLKLREFSPILNRPLLKKFFEIIPDLKNLGVSVPFLTRILKTIAFPEYNPKHEAFMKLALDPQPGTIPVL